MTDVAVNMPVSCAMLIAANNTKMKGSIEISHLTSFGVVSGCMLLDFYCSIVTRGADIFLQLQVDLLHPTPDSEKRKHKLKRLVQSPNSYFMDVKCPGRYGLLIAIFIVHPQVVIKSLLYLATRKLWLCV